MSKHARGVPAPFYRSLPTVIRTFGPRLLLLGTGIAALLVLGSGTYLLSHVIGTPKAPVGPVPNARPLHQSAVLGDSTSIPTTPQPASSTGSAAASSPTASPSNSGSAASAENANPADSDTSSVSVNLQQPSVEVQTPVIDVHLNLPLGHLLGL